MRQAGRLARDALEDVVHERVHDAHGLGGDARVGVHLFQHLVHVHRVALLAAALALLAVLLLGLGDGLLGALLRGGSGLRRLRHLRISKHRNLSVGWERTSPTYRAFMLMKDFEPVSANWKKKK
uniref:Histone protein Hist1h1e n=1 Tax=Mus musculus TaxID=10090 RepID=Q8CGP9_MOUSE|nr:histone protein Hist1h1e [Mus musculus]